MLCFDPDLTLDQIGPILQRSGDRGVVLSAHTPSTSAGEAELNELAADIDVPPMLGGAGSDHPFPAFEPAGGVRLGLRTAGALQVLASRVPVHSGGSAGNCLRDPPMQTDRHMSLVWFGRDLRLWDNPALQTALPPS